MAVLLCFVCAPVRMAGETKEPCELAGETLGWMQRALDGWEVARDEVLRFEARPLPWMIFFDESCAWHVEPDQGHPAGGMAIRAPLSFGSGTVRVVAEAHGGNVLLPDGSRRPAVPMAFTSAYSGPRGAFFVVALPVLWRKNWKPTDPPVDDFFLAVTMHELAHTYQINALLHRVEALAKHYKIPSNVDDDIVESTFKNDVEYRDLFQLERELFYRAATDSDKRRAMILMNAGLEIADMRREKFFSGEHEVLAELEPLFLNLEGVGGWVAYQMAKRDPANFAVDDVVKTRGVGTDWVQGESLALALLIDRFVPHWRQRMLPPEFVSPFKLLHEAAAEAKSVSVLQPQP